MATYTFEFRGPVSKKVDGDRLHYFWDVEGMNHWNLDKAKLVALQSLTVKFVEDANKLAKADLEAGSKK